MSGYLIAEEGTLMGMVLPLEDGDEWIIGRDPDVASIILEDPIVSRKHLIIRLRDEGTFVENLSSVNPAHLNGKPITESTRLQEGDTLQIGSTFFRYTEEAQPEKATAPLVHTTSDEGLTQLSFTENDGSRYVIKVISGPNTGAEFSMQPDSSYVIGKDPESCDLVFQDLSVSRQHAKITIKENGLIQIEDLASRNGVLINGRPIAAPHLLTPQDIIALGTTSFLIIDREQSSETIFSPGFAINSAADSTAEEALEKEAAEEEARQMAKKSWKEMIIPTKHLVIGGIFVAILFFGLTSILSLFTAKPVEIVKRDETGEIKTLLKDFPGIEFSYNPASMKIFVVGHVLNEVNHQELVYLLQTLSYIKSIEDNVVIDEFVWEDTNALLMNNPAWRSVTLTGPAPGRFLLRGYIEDMETAAALYDWINRNFNYLDRLENKVVVEQTLRTQIGSMLLEKGFSNVLFQFNSGELMLTGAVNTSDEKTFNKTIAQIKTLDGIRQIKNFVVMTNQNTSSIDITGKYPVTGSSKFDGVSQYVVINRKILSVGDNIDGLTITAIEPETIFLEKDGLKFKINYNQQ